MTRRELLKAERQELIKILTKVLWFTRTEDGKKLIWEEYLKLCDKITREEKPAFYMGNKDDMVTRKMIDTPENIVYLVCKFAKEIIKDPYYTHNLFEIKGLSKQQALKFAQTQKWI